MAAAARSTTVVAADSRSQDGAGCLTVGTAAAAEVDIESTTSELPCGASGGAQQTLVRGGSATGGGGARVTVDVAVLKREDKSLQTTIMLITVSTSYVLAYLPVLVQFVVYFIMLQIDPVVVSTDRSTTRPIHPSATYN